MYFFPRVCNLKLKLLFAGSTLFLCTFCWSQKQIASKKIEKESSAPKADTSKDFPPFIKVAANPDLKGNSIKKIFIGKNYRREWAEPVEGPVLNFRAAGITPQKEGGGKETRSLKVEAKDGKSYSLRSVKKYPKNAIPPELRKTIAEKIVSDDISASYPYGALSMATLSEAEHVPYLKTKLVFIPDDQALDKFRSKYKNSLVFMEDKEPAVDLSVIDSEENIKTYSTQKLVFDLQKSIQSKVDQKAMLQARLLDNFVMDFDRHEGQWEWMKLDSGKNKIYYPIPKDRDQVFYTNQGLLPKIVRSKGMVPEIQGFRAKAKDPVTFNNPARNIDRVFLTALNEKDWQAQIDAFLKAMTDSVIEAALYQQPKEIQKFSVQKIINTLKEKRKYFSEDMMKYYKKLSQIVSIVGSNEAEQFNVVTCPKGGVIVTIRKLDKGGDPSSASYERVFDPKVTKEIRIYGLEGNDRFMIEGEKSKIKIRLIGGPGEDEFINKSKDKKLWVYDVNFEKNSVSGNGIKNRISGDPMNNEYQRLGFKYNKAGMGISAEYAYDGGIYIGPQYKIVKQSFRKEPYGSSQVFSANKALNASSWLFRYKADFIKAIGKTDLLVRAEYFFPTARTHFFGLGNETLFDKTKPGKLEYYRARYELGNFAVLARKHLNSWMDLSVGPSFQYFKIGVKENAGKFISSTDVAGFNSQLHEANYYAGAEAHCIVNRKNDEVIPTRGIFIDRSIRSLFKLNGPGSNLTQLEGNASFYTDFLSKKMLVLAVSVGGSINFGDYQYPQAQYLGFTDHLRGYQIQRFGGRARAYNNVELRWKVTNVNAYLFRASFGLLAFNDVGRVWVNEEESSIWHDGWGGGVWIAPFDKIVLTGCLTYSKEEKNLGLITVG